VGCRGAAQALDRGWGAAAAAVDDEQKLRRRSGEVRWSEEEMAVEMWVWEGKRESAGSSRICSGSRRRCGHARAGAGNPAGVVAARVAAA
jgi:hypothetical protein